MAMEKATPWSMCTAEEAYDRERHMELSEFEATENTFHLPPSRRIADATLCIKKYRRSAAGGGTASSFSQSSSESDEKPSNFRSLTELDDAVEHLLKSILCHQKSHHENMTPRPLSKTAAFVDDRLRAVQVDYVVGHSTTNNSTYEDFHFAHRFHSRMIRYNILIGYLMSEPHVSPSKFEHKFNAHALQSSFSNYFQLFTNHLNLVQSHNDYQSHLETLDEMMCYATILNVSSVLLKQEIMFNATSLCKRLPLFQDGSSFGLLSYANLYLNLKPSLSSTKDEEMFPKWKWAIEVALAADLGNFIRCLDLVIEKSDFILEKNHIQRESRWKCLVRCLLSPTLPTMRIGLLRWYNKSFGKGEKVSGADLARLLHYKSSKEALDFCELAGLPLTEDRSKAIFKIAPISVSKQTKGEPMNMNALINERNDDLIFFGEGFDQRNDTCDKQDIPDMNSHARFDSDNVRIPPSNLFWSLLE